MPRRAAGATATARPALGTVDANVEPEALTAPIGKGTAKAANKTELLRNLKAKEEENESLRSKTSELEDQLAALTEQLNSVQINTKKPTAPKDVSVPSVQVMPLPPAPTAAAPKRYTTAYMHFCNAKRDEVRASNPSASAAEIMKELGTLWKALPPFSPEISRFNELADQDRARYDEEMRVYKTKQAQWEEEKKAVEYYNQQIKTQAALELYDETVKNQRTKPAGTKTEEELVAPKKPMSAFMFFQADKRKAIKAKNPAMDFTEISKQVSEEWAKVQKRKNGTKAWNQLALADKDRYENEMGVYEQKLAAQKKEQDERVKAEYGSQLEKAKNVYKQKVEGEAAVSEYKRNKAVEEAKMKEERIKLREEKQRKKEEKEKMPKRNMTAFFFFSRDAREHVKLELSAVMPSPSVTDVSTELGKRWATLPDNQKEYYSQLAAEDKARYAAQMAEYNRMNA